MTKTTLKKYNIGSPKRASRKKYSSFKKYNIGHPRRPSSFLEDSIINKGSPRRYREEIKHVTPRTAAWEKWAKKGEPGYIHDYEEDEDDKALAIKRGQKPSPETYTTFEDIQTRYMTEAYKKKPLTDTIEQVDEEAWEQKKDDSPNQRAGKRGSGKRGSGKRGSGKRGSGKRGSGKRGSGKRGSGKRDSGKRHSRRRCRSRR
jgi:hypothetical protein